MVFIDEIFPILNVFSVIGNEPYTLHLLQNTQFQTN